MGFLIASDYHFQIKNEIKTIIAGAEVNALELAEFAAQAEMESYLNSRYDVPAIFSAEDPSRNRLLVMYLVDMVLYHLHSKMAGRLVPDIRAVRYDTAKTWLEQVMLGKLSPDLPLKPIADDGSGNDADYLLRTGSNKKYSQDW